MAILQSSDHTLTADPTEIADVLSPFGIHLGHYSPTTSLPSPELLAQDILTQDEKQQILELHERDFEFLKQQGQYRWCHLVALHPGSPQLSLWTETYRQYHVHSDPEALYVLSGEILFGFVKPDGSRFQLLLESQDFLHIPANVEHWSSLTASLTLKAIHYCLSATGWMPRYTGTNLSETLGM